jgi:hypothetical protein
LEDEVMIEEARALSAEEVLAQSELELAEYLNGDGPNRRAQHVKAARPFGGELAELIEANWDTAIETKRKWWEAEQAAEAARLAKEEALFICPAPLPRVAGEVGAQGEVPVKLVRRENEVAKPAEAVATLATIVGEIAKKVEAGAEAGPEVQPDEEEGDEAPGVLNPKAPLDNARRLVGLQYWNKKEGCLSLQYWQGQFWEWCGTHWRALDGDTVRSRMYGFLDGAEKEIKRNYFVRFEPDAADVSRTVDALKAAVNFEPENEMPGWLGGEAPVGNLRELIACKNGLLYVPTRRLFGHTPKFWSPMSLSLGMTRPLEHRGLSNFWRSSGLGMGKRSNRWSRWLGCA